MAEVFKMEKQKEQEKSLTVSQQQLPSIASGEGSIFLNVQRFEFAQRVAKLLASSTMVPDHFRNNIGNCVIALNLADRFKADPFMIMQNIYVVHGKPGLEGKLVIALINKCGKFTPLQFRFQRDENGKPIACTAYAKHKETGETLEQTVTWEMVEAEGWNIDKKNPKTGYVQKSKWNTMPEIMFQYRAATFFARVYCPEVILGMPTADELEDIIDVIPAENGSYQMPAEQPQEYPDFDELIGQKKLDKGTKDLLDRFLEEAARANNTELEKVKNEAAKDFDGFWEIFKKWQEKNKPSTSQDNAGESDEAINWDAWVSEWINLRTSKDPNRGFMGYVNKNLVRFLNAPEAIQKQARRKWQALYPDEPWPLDATTAAPEETKKETQVQADERPTLQCPESGDSVLLTYCDEACPHKAQCAAYKDYYDKMAV